MIKKALVSLLLFGIFSCQSVADDVEIYFGANGANQGSALVMFALDYRPNLTSTVCNGIQMEDAGPDFSSCGWTATFPEFNASFQPADYSDGEIVFFEMLRAALRHVFTEPELAAADLQFGLMLNHDHKNGCEGEVTDGCSNGGYIAMGFRDHNAGEPNGTEQLLKHLEAIPLPQGNLSHPYQGKELYFEFFRYLSGQDIFNGHVGHIDYGDGCGKDNLNDTRTPTPGCRNDIDFDSLLHWDSSIESEDAYVSPWADGSKLECSSAYIVNFMFGVTNQDSDSDTEIEKSKDSGGLALDLSGNNGKFNSVIDRLYDLDMADGSWGTAIDLAGKQNVVSHFVYKGNVQNTMNGYALAGGGRAIEVSDDPRLLTEELKNLFLGIIRQTSTFEAPAVTVNSYNRLSHLDSLYYALFAPEMKPDWPGNMKKYRLGEIEVDLDGDLVTDTNVITVLDANDNPAITADGLFEVGACSFWSDCSDGPDGDEVELGGSVNKLTANRKLYTNTGIGKNETLSIASNKLHESNYPTEISADMLGVTLANVPDVDGDGNKDGDDMNLFSTQLLRIGRGVDESDPDTALKTMGDPIHSRPAVIIYDGDLDDAGANPDISIIMTTNEGYMHLIDADDGTEHFAFIPQELLPMIRMVNKEESASSGKFRYDIYGLDGSPVVLRKDLNGNEIIEKAEGDKVIVYLTQRRGGRNIYAVDITDRDNPVLLWTILGGAMNSFADLAETWSEPVLSKILVNKVKTDVLVFGGGYDSDRYDNDPGDPDDNVDIGRNVYIVNAHTGDLIWRIGPDIDANLQITTMADSIPSPIEILDFKDDQVMDRIYFIDVIGRIHKVDFDNSSGENTAIYGGGLVMDLSNNDPANNVDQDSCDMSVAGNICRRFYNALDVAVMTKYPVANYIQLAVGSGFRAHPKMINTQDRFYVVYDNQLLYKVKTKDYAATYGWKEADNLVDVTDIGNGSKKLQEQSETLYGSLTAADKHGWYLDMDKDLGEKVISESITINGIVMFSTYLPRTSSEGPDVCSADLGGGRLYLTNAFDGMPVASLDQDSDAELLQVTDTVKKSQRFTLLPRAGMPTSPSIVFKKMASGDVTPTVVVGTQLPLNQDLLDITLETGTWWFEK